MRESTEANVGAIDCILTLIEFQSLKDLSSSISGAIGAKWRLVRW